eukprot:CAMPEP_0182908924 /NCGR_PEP_ID=MMETSP0034_2-20130328/35472_1 /TAXON_ID=156128 /ORGANISM="Nephroselmis pyriformis, Strain CCMP717" /LENGTH=55 /DNA_ID=CAMNT_0025045135 /DNA_START=122 /DNA_END=285 /DNA_ORIENTATION=+
MAHPHWTSVALPFVGGQGFGGRGLGCPSYLADDLAAAHRCLLLQLPLGRLEMALA